MKPYSISCNAVLGPGAVRRFLMRLFMFTREMTVLIVISA